MPRAEDAEMLAREALDWLLGSARDPGGVNWAVRPSPPRSHHIAHGTMGIAYSRAAVGAATGHRELIELALAGASDLFDDLAARATIDGDGVRWSNHEHRVTPSALEPRTGWSIGNAGIVRELLRFAHASTGTDPAYAVPWPDHSVVGATAQRFGRF